MNSVCDTPRTQPERSQHARVDFRQRRGRPIVLRQRPGHEDAAFMRDRHRRSAVAARRGEDDPPIEDERVDVIDVAGNELLEDVVRLRVAKRSSVCQRTSLGIDLLDADGRRLRARLQDPRGRHARRPVAEAAWFTTWMKSGQRMPAPRARARMASLSRKARLVVSPIPGTCRYSRSIAAISTSKSSSATMRSSRSSRARKAAPLRMSALRHVAPDEVEGVDGLAGPVRVAQLLVGEQEHATPLAPALPQELVTFPIRRDAQYGQRHGKTR